LPYFGDCTEDKTGGTYSTQGRDYKGLKTFNQNLKVRSNFEGLGIEGKIILKWISSNNNYLFFYLLTPSRFQGLGWRSG